MITMDTVLERTSELPSHEERHHVTGAEQEHRQALHQTTRCYQKANSAANDDPSSLDYYRGVYDHLASTEFGSSQRVGSVEVVPPNSLPSDSPYSPNGPDTEIGLLRISSILAFASSRLDGDGNVQLVPRGNAGIGIYGDVAGALLGMHHFNNGIGSVVAEVAGINQTCPIRFVADFYDSESSQVTAVDIFSRQILESPDRPPSALFGAWRSAVSVPLGILTGVYGIPQVSPLSTSTELDDVTQYTHFTRLIPSDAGTARAAVDYFRDRSPTLRHLGMLYVNDAYGSAFHQAIVESAQAIMPEEERITVRGSPFSYNNAIQNPEEINLAVKALAESGFRVFFGVFYDEHYEIVMKAAIEFGIAGPGYVWILGDGVGETLLNDKAFPADSALAIASQGVGILKAEGGRQTAEGNTGYDRFVKEWYSQGDDSIDYYNCVGHPADNTVGDPSIYYQAEAGFFDEEILPPTAGATFNYDSVMAMGLAACGLVEESGSAYFSGTELFDGFVQQSFEGASGNVAIDPATTSRDPKSAFFVLYNTDGTTKDGTTTFSVETVSHTARSQDPDATIISWVNMDGKEYVYSDGTTTFPQPLPTLEHNYNYLGPGVRGAGLALAGLVFVTALFFASWTFRYRSTRVVRASQPMFLHMIIAGTVIMAATIITLSFDDRVASQAGCDVACALNPWLITYGFVISFSSLFAKTWRVNKIFDNPNCRRIKVTVKDVILPCVVMFILNTIVLAVWTAISPLRWTRIDRGTVDAYGRSTNSYGTCHAETKEWAPYLSIILALNFSMVVLANIQAYRARKITTEYAESRFIGIIMVSILQACCIGLPLVAIVSDQPVANFILRSGLIFVVCMSMLLLMFVPKIRYLKKWKVDKKKKEKLKMEKATARKRAMERAVALGYAKSQALRAAGIANAANANGTDDTAATTGFTLSIQESESRRVSDLGMDNGMGTKDEAAKKPPMKPALKSAAVSRRWRAAAAAVSAANSLSSLKKSDNSAASAEDHGKEVGTSNGGSQASLNIDEELAIMDAVEGIPRTAGGDSFEEVHSDDDVDDDDDDMSLSTASSVEVDDGCMRIITHRKGDPREMQLLKAQLDHMKIEKLEMYGKIQGLRLLLKNNGITDFDEELESLTGTNNSRFESERSEREDSHAEQSQSSSVRGLERSHSDKASKQASARPTLRGFASTRWNSAGVNKIASQSVRFRISPKKFDSNRSLKGKGKVSEESTPPPSSRGKVAWAIDVTTPSSAKETAELQAMEEGGVCKSPDNIKENRDEDQPKSSTPNEAQPQAPDLSRDGEGRNAEIGEVFADEED